MAGKRIRGAIYIHRTARHLLDRSSDDRLSRAEALTLISDWNVARIEDESVGLLVYESFDVAFPALLESTRIVLATGDTTRRNYRLSTNPQILHRKELLVDPSDPRTAAWAQLTDRAEALGLFRENHRIGRRLQWEKRLAAVGLRVDDGAA